MVKNKKAIPLFFFGLLLLAGSIWIFSHQHVANERAKQASAEILKSWQSDARPSPSKQSVSPQAPTQNLLGVLRIPTLSLTLPIFKDCTEELLEISPCRYAGTSPTEAGLVLSGHSYDAHFGRLSALEVGDRISIEVENGRIISYKVISYEYIGGDEPEALKASNYDLTLFTCSFDGADRFLLRFQQVEAP